MLMDQHALEYFQPYSDDSLTGHFHRVIALHDNPEFQWQTLSKESPLICRGWFELAHLTPTDRITFLHDFWVTKLPYHPRLESSLTQFFDSLDDIGIFVTQLKFDDSCQVQLVYSIANNGGFYQGFCPATEDEIIALKNAFIPHILPTDYLAFLQIHNGFAKLNDTGILPSSKVPGTHLLLQSIADKPDRVLTSDDKIVDPRTLIPFYESFGMPFFQCFWTEWYPENEMGNVYYSDTTNSISNCTQGNSSIETMAFNTFTDWLLFYLEKIE